MTATTLDIPFNRSALEGRELEYIFQTITIGQIAGDQTFSKKCHKLLEETLGVHHLLHPRVGDGRTAARSAAR
jgi:dTDP-4-amino-4,6-dideoxygalactose transaminase